MGRFANLVNTLEKKEAFKAKYGIAPNISMEYCEVGEHIIRKPMRAVAILMITFIKRWDEDTHG